MEEEIKTPSIVQPTAPPEKPSSPPTRPQIERRYEHVEALAYNHTVSFPTYISTINYYEYSQSWIDAKKQCVDNHDKVVLIPIEYSLEHYLENDVKIASFCEYHSFRIDKEYKDKNLFDHTIGFRCLRRCKITNAVVSNGRIFVDVDIIDKQPLQESQELLRKSIYERLKEFLKYGYVSLSDIEDIKRLTLSPLSDLKENELEDSLDYLVALVANNTKFDISARRKLLFETDNTKRLELLNAELETRIYEQSCEKGKDTIGHYKNKINQLDLSADIKKIAYQELTRLKSINPGQSEYGNIIDWLDRFVSLPWNNIKQENTDIDFARKTLNETHYGMEKIKNKILDYIAIKMITGKTPSTIICLYGPPGVGKTTIVKSIAKALNKDYYGLSLGGINDPEELKGIKRFFIGAKPGRIMEGVTQAGSKNCIILLDELDKIGTNGQRGNPYSILMDVLDKNQNMEFKDAYFDIPFDLSQVMFIATANDLREIPEPLKNRMEIITIDGFSVNEKIHIGIEHILPKSLKTLGVRQNLINIEPKTIQTLIEEYTFESGVRQLERLIMDICKRYLIECEINKKPLKKTTISIGKARKYVDKDYFKDEYNVALKDEIGVVNKMCVYGPTGSISRLEITLVKGTGKQILSDNIIGTANWTFKTVFGLVESRMKKWEIDEDVFTKNDFYIHSPYHSISQDGPSGGVADVLCLISAIKEVPINYKLAFTGEISLKGKVLAIGGIKEKLLAAQRSGMDTAVVPLANKKDVEKLSSEILGNMKIKYIDNIDEAYNYVFGKQK